MRTVPAAPGSTRIDPDPDETVRSTAPGTLSVRSKEPSGACAAAGAAQANDSAAAHTAAAPARRRTGSMAIMTTHDLPGSLDENSREVLPGRERV